MSEVNSQPLSLERVVVVYGGQSAERDVSLKSGAAILAALKRQGVNVQGYDLREGGLAGLEKLAPTAVLWRCTAVVVRMAPCKARLSCWAFLTRAVAYWHQH